MQVKILNQLNFLIFIDHSKNMKLILLFLLFALSNVAYSQTPPSTDNPQNDTLIIEDAADTDPEFIWVLAGLVKYLNDSLRWDEVEQWVADQKAPISNKVTVKLIVNTAYKYIKLFPLLLVQ